MKRAKASEELSASQLAELEAMPSVSERQTVDQRMVTLVEEIRALGPSPRDDIGLAQRVRRALRQSLLSDSQLAELAELQAFHRRERMDPLIAEIRALGYIPRETRAHSEECKLGYRLRYAKANSLLSESQLAELAEIARSSDEPVRKRLRVMND